LYNSSTQEFTKITSSKHRETGLVETTYSWSANPHSWLSSSTEGNDLIHTRFGTYHLQSETHVDNISKNSYVSSASPNGQYKWSGHFLNSVKVNGNEVYSSRLLNLEYMGILWSTDSKSFAVVAETDIVIIDSIFNYFYEIYIINAEKTFTEGKIVIDKSLSIKDHDCSFRASFNAQYVN